MRQVAAVDKRLENAIDGGLGNVCTLIDFLERPRRILLLHQFQNIERLGQDGNHIQSAAERIAHSVSPQRELFSGSIPLAANFNTDIRFVLTGPHSGTTVASRRASLWFAWFSRGSTALPCLTQEQRGPFARTKSLLGRVLTLAWWFGVRKLLRSLSSSESLVVGNLLFSRRFLQLNHCALVLGLRVESQCGPSPS